MAKAFLNWSSGKDAAMALYLSRKDQSLEVSKLVTTVNKDTSRVSMHGLHRELLNRQLEAIGLPSHMISLSGDAGMAEYTTAMENAFRDLKTENFTHAVYGDIYLEDLREYRDKTLAKLELVGEYPLWKKDTGELSRVIIDLGFKAITIAVSDKKLGKSFCGKAYDHDFLDNLPEGVDPCGENGEFHTFVFDGPIFKDPVSFKKGKVVKRDLSISNEDQTNWESIFWYCDLI